MFFLYPFYSNIFEKIFSYEADIGDNSNSLTFYAALLLSVLVHSWVKKNLFKLVVHPHAHTHTHTHLHIHAYIYIKLRKD